MLYLAHMNDSVASQVKRYISQNAHLREFVRRGLINYSALAREVCHEMQVPFCRAAVMAASRYAERLSRQGSEDRKFAGILRRAKLTVRARMLVAGIRRDTDRRRVAALHAAVKEFEDDLTIVEGFSMLSVATASRHKQLVRSIFKDRIHTLLDEVAQIVIETRKEAMFTPGLSGYILGRLSGAGINVIEEYTCAGEHLLIVMERDLPGAIDALRVSAQGVRGR